MLSFPEGAPVYLRTGITDMRKSTNGLSAIVQDEMNLSPFNRGYFVFCGRPGISSSFCTGIIQDLPFGTNDWRRQSSPGPRKLKKSDKSLVNK